MFILFFTFALTYYLFEKCSRGWCLFEIGTRAKAVKANSGLRKTVFIADKVESKAEDFVVRELNYFRFMETFDAVDRVKIQKKILESFTIPEFNQVVIEAAQQAEEEVIYLEELLTFSEI